MSDQNQSIQPPRYDVEGRYQSLLEAGEKLLCEGYDQAQPKRIAAEAGVSVGLFYKHFGSKRDLLAAVMVYRLGILHQQIEEALAAPLSIRTAHQFSPEQLLEIIIVRTLTYFQSHQGLIRLFFMQIGYGDEQATRQLSEVRANYRRILRSVIERGIQQRCFVRMDFSEIEMLVSSIVGTLNWTIYERLGTEGRDLKPQIETALLSKLFLRGIQVETTATSKEVN